MAYIPRLKQEYKDKVMSALIEEFGYKNVMQVPKLQKIVISRGVGDAVADKKLIDYAVDEMTKISGQLAVSTISKNFSISKSYGGSAKMISACIEVLSINL